MPPLRTLAHRHGEIVERADSLGTVSTFVTRSAAMTQPPLARIAPLSAQGRWALDRRAPTATLRPDVRRLERSVEEGGRPAMRREGPILAIPLIVTVGPGFRFRDPARPDRSRALPRSFVAGLFEPPGGR